MCVCSGVMWFNEIKIPWLSQISCLLDHHDPNTCKWMHS